MKFLLPVAWFVFASEVLLLLWAAAFAASEMGSDSQERTTTLIFGILALLALIAVGVTLAYAQRSQSRVATFAGLTAALFPAMVWVAMRGSDAFNSFDRARSKAAVASEQTPLGQAITHVLEDYSGSSGLAEVRSLIQAGARPSDDDLGPNRSLMPTILVGNSPGSDELLDIILQAGANPNATDEQHEPLIHMVECTLPKLKVLVRHNVDLNARSRREDRREWSVLMTAATLRDWDKVDYLLEQGVSPSYRSQTGDTFATVLAEVARLELATSGKLDPRQQALMTRYSIDPAPGP